MFWTVEYRTSPFEVRGNPGGIFCKKKMINFFFKYFFRASFFLLIQSLKVHRPTVKRLWNYEMIFKIKN